MAELKDLSTTDASNTARWPENMNPSQVNDAGRADEGMLARFNFDAVEGNVDSTGSANAYLVSANRTIAAYYDGMRQCFHANFANTGSATLNIDSVGAKTIKKNHDQDLASGDIEQHQFVEVVYSASDDTFQMLSPVAVVPLTGTGNTTITLADDGAGEGPLLTLFRNSANPADSDLLGALVYSGKDDGGNTITYAKIGSTLVDNDNAGSDGNLLLQTVVGDTLATRATVGQGIVVGAATGGDQGAGTVNATAFYDDGVQLTQGTLITTGTPCVKSPYATSSSTVQAHGLAGAPKLVSVILECLTAEGNYSIGDKIDLSASTMERTLGNVSGPQILVDATNVTILIGSSALEIVNKTGFGAFAITAANWKVTATPYHW
jgi:hypothetical protein